MKWYFVGALCVMMIVLTLESHFQFSFLGRSERSGEALPLPNDDPPDMRVQDVFVVEQATAEKSKSWELFCAGNCVLRHQAAGPGETITSQALSA